MTRPRIKKAEAQVFVAWRAAWDEFFSRIMCDLPRQQAIEVLRDAVALGELPPEEEARVKALWAELPEPNSIMEHFEYTKSLKNWYDSTMNSRFSDDAEPNLELWPWLLPEPPAEPQGYAKELMTRWKSIGLPLRMIESVFLHALHLARAVREARDKKAKEG